MKKDIMDYVGDCDNEITKDDVYCGDDCLYRTIGKIKIYKKECSTLVHKYGMVLSMVCIGNEPDTYLIFTDNIFSEFPKEYQGAFLEHEIGHIVSGYLDDMQKKAVLAFMSGISSENLFKRKIKAEMDADKYAAEQIGAKSIIDGLQYYIDNYKIPKDAQEELESRIKILEAMG